MQTINELLPGVKLITHKRFVDSRGDFCEFWKTDNDGLRGTYRQLNIASSRFNVLRGLHRQDQTKLIMPVFGKIFDVVLDPETGAWCAAILDPNIAFLIPPQYAHGYLVLSDHAVVQYIVDTPYIKEVEEQFAWNRYGIEWPTTEPVLSEKDTPK